MGRKLKKYIPLIHELTFSPMYRSAGALFESRSQVVLPRNILRGLIRGICMSLRTNSTRKKSLEEELLSFVNTVVPLILELNRRAWDEIVDETTRDEYIKENGEVPSTRIVADAVHRIVTTKQKFVHSPLYLVIQADTIGRYLEQNPFPGKHSPKEWLRKHLGPILETLGALHGCGPKCKKRTIPTVTTIQDLCEDSPSQGTLRVKILSYFHTLDARQIQRLLNTRLF